MSDGDDDTVREQTAAGPRDAHGRYVKGVSGNPAGKPLGCLNHATRIAAALLNGEAETLWRTEIDLAKGGDRALLMHCNDKIIGARHGQPVLFPMPPVSNAGDLAAAIGSVLNAVARGLVTPAEGEALTRAAEAGARAVEAGERIERERFTEEEAAFERRFELAACALLFYAVREIDEEAGDLDYRLRELCKPILRLGASALSALAAIPYTPERADADRAFAATHPPRPDRDASPFGAEMSRCVAELCDHIERNADRIERKIEQREAAGNAPTLRYRTGLFERLLGLEPTEMEMNPGLPSGRLT